MVDKNFSRVVEDCCDKALCALGAKRPRRGTRFFEVSKDVLCWIGLNQGKHETFIRVNPFVGVHVVPLMKLESEFDGDKYKKGDFATISVHLGELCPDVEEFVFNEGSNLEPEATRLAQAIFEFSLPYARKYAEIESILPELKSKIPSLGGYPERFAIALYLAGKLEEAKQFISDTQARYAAEESEGVQTRFESFSNLFLEKINN